MPGEGRGRQRFKKQTRGLIRFLQANEKKKNERVRGGKGVWTAKAKQRINRMERKKSSGEPSFQRGEYCRTAEETSGWGRH